MRGAGSCYGTTYMAHSRMFCCDGVPFPCPSPSGFACCGKRLVNSQNTLCCKKDVYPKGPNTACCDKYYMDTTMAVCCHGEKRPTFGRNMYCCHKKPYDPQLQVCCNNQDIFPKVDAAYNLACTPGNDAPDRQGPPPGYETSPGGPQPRPHPHPHHHAGAQTQRSPAASSRPFSPAGQNPAIQWRAPPTANAKPSKKPAAAPQSPASAAYHRQVNLLKQLLGNIPALNRNAG
ncbi:uncharacterized protein LOC143284911 [Babylonia areolata]|uniref:uncharacterized protein LOC143284911 n=1 Tax=Babylonia areolata TaxID=304850 RepID=UPI003FD282F8